MLALRVPQHAAAIGLAYVDQRAERVERGFEIARLLRHDNDLIVLPVVGDRNAGAVEDAAASRRQQPQIDAVLVGQEAVAVFFEDLQVVHTAGKDARQRRLAAGEQRRPAGETLLSLGFARHRRRA